MQFFGVLVCGALLNILLLYLIRRFSRKDLGQYKTILTVFVAYDVYLCALHHVSGLVWIAFSRCDAGTMTDENRLDKNRQKIVSSVCDV